MNDNGSGSGRDPVDLLLESFLGRLRRGERPSLDDYAARCPERAEEIRELFPALIEMEQLKPAVGIETGPVERPPARPEPAGRPAAPHPERLGEYRILRVVGEGGMGVVFEAEHESLSNRVALKVMHARFRADGSHLRRFRQEARSAARLHHTNIVPVFDFGEQGGICYYAMQYIAGVGLNEVLDDVRRLRADSRGAVAVGGAGAVRDDRCTEPIGDAASVAARGLWTGRFSTAPPTPTGSDVPTELLEPGQGSRTTPVGGPGPPMSGPRAAATADGAGSSSFARQPESIYCREIARLGAQVADALDFAHRQKVVHRDIKPSNLLLDARGDVWVTDFGLAKLVEEDGLSQSRDLVGTLRYMSPERFRGVNDRRGDIYALGATLYEMLALRAAFEGRDQIELIDQITHQPPVPLRQHDRRIPRDLETLVLKAMAKDAEDRFATAGELRDELRRFLEGRPIRSRPVPVYERLWRWCRRNRTLAAATMTAAILLVVVLIGSPIAAWTYRFQLKRVEIEQGLTRANLERALAAERQGRLELGKSHQAEGAALQRTGLVGQRFDSLERLSQAAGLLRESPEGRGRLPDLRDLAITAMGLTDLRPIERIDVGPMMEVACDPALGRYATIEWLAKGSVGGLTVVRSMADGRELFRIPRPAESIRWAWLEFGPDGRYLSINYQMAEGPNLIDFWDTERKALAFRRRSIDRCFHPDGRRVILRPTEKEVSVCDLVDGREIQRLSLGFVPAAIRLDADGRRLAANAASGPRRLEIIELETGHALATWTENVGNERAISWSRDGHLLAVGNDDARIFVRDVARGSLASVLHEHSRGLLTSEFASRGSLLVTTSWPSSARVWDGSTGELLVTVPIGRSAWISNDARRLALYAGSHLEIWEIAHEQEVITLNPGRIGNRTDGEGRGVVKATCFSPDGRLVAVATAETTHLYDAHDGRELARLEAGPCETLLFDRDGRNLITASDRGLFRWPVGDDAGGRDALRIGPPVLLHETSSADRHKANWLPDGRTLALNDHDHSRILLVDTEHRHPARQRARWLSTPFRSRMISVAVSRDGRWVAAGGWNDPGVYVWDLPRRRFERVLPRGDTPADGHTLPAFSPDGRWLVFDSDIGAGSGYDFWEVGTWRRGPFIPRPITAGWGEPVFSPDGAMIAVSHDANRIRLADPATGGTIAHLTTVQSLAPTPMAFSPDGTRLIAMTNRSTAMIWDLRRIRDRLRTMGLDWDRPAFPPEEASAGASLPAIRSIRVLGEAPRPAARRAADLAACEARLRDRPDDVDALLDRGWLKLKMAKPAEAIADLERGSRLRPEDADALELLATAQIQTTDPAAARTTLERYLRLAGDDTDARVLKGRLALRLGRLQEADDDAGKVLDLDPARGAVRFARAEIRVRLGRLVEALADLDALVPSYPEDSQLLLFRGEVHQRMGHREQARADMERAAGLPGAPALVYNNAAWRLATGPAALRDPPRAVELARKAIAASPDAAIFLNTLGVAQYRAGQFAEAVATLEKSLAASKGESDGFDLFFLAMARHRLGRAGEARADFDRARKWRRERPNRAEPGWSEELDSFEAEARDILDGSGPELPADVFAPAAAGPAVSGERR